NRCLPDTLCVPDIPGVATYQWLLDGTPLDAPSGSLPELIATESGSYQLSMVGTNGCSVTSSPLNLDLFEEEGSFVGFVYIDLDNDGSISLGDSLYNGAQIDLFQGGTVLATATTQGDSSYTFSELPPGDYQLLLD
ncbi:SdrD B-like domain-containing protein, partial [Arthrospira platensis SPKY1]|nr:SdrD B-like domain-containing protein [Arthrospira platensis SPKY1]